MEDRSTEERDLAVPVAADLDERPADTVPQTVRPSRVKRVIERALSFYGIAFAIAAIAILAFGFLANEVLDKQLVDLNREVMLAIHSTETPTLTTIAFAATNLGSVLGVTILGLLFAGFLYHRKRYIDLIAFAIAVLGSVLLTQILKRVFQQIRPDVFPPLAVETSFSFPSGHTLSSFCLWGFIGFWVLRGGPKELWRWLVMILCLAIAAAVGASRMYVGVHWPTDVLAGMIVAAFWVTACFVGERWATKRRARGREGEGERVRRETI